MQRREVLVDLVDELVAKRSSRGGIKSEVHVSSLLNRPPSKALNAAVAQPSFRRAEAQGEREREQSASVTEQV